MATTEDMAALGRRCWGMLEPVHAVGYFAPETRQAYVDLGLHPRLSYFAARSAALGRVGPGVCTATFYVFAPWLAQRALPSSWEIASPAAVQQARRHGMAAALRRILGSPDVSEALELARTACAALGAAGRPLYAAHAELDWPDHDLMALWHAATLIREHRGDGHVAVLQSVRLDPVESLVVGGLFSGNTDFVKSTRGWSDAEWAAAVDRLRGRGLLDGSGALTDDGGVLRQEVEHATDVLAAEGWAHVGESGCQRLVELLAPLRAQVIDSDTLPGWFSSRS